MNTFRFLLLSFALVSLAPFALVACGGATPPPGPHHGTNEAGHGPEHGGDAHAQHEGEHGKHHGEGEHGKHHASMDAEVKAFHDILRPVYHDKPGPERAAKACAAVPEFETRGTAIASSRKDDAAKGRATTLTTEVAALKTACAAGPSGAEPQLEKLHDAFHGVMEGK